ncbi:MAG TPA: alpha/beta fold hydrolase [Solirubrobacterales bacterium]|nr:alpha/beta fold hydrolase [Solirubrobacterales bacterium]
MSPIDVEKGSAFPADDYGNPDPKPEWLRIDWREHLRRIELPGAEVNYADYGEGEPVIFVHGLAGCWRNWLENVPYFAKTHRVLALDLPGFGDSPKPSWEISMPAYGQLLHDFCEKLGIDHVAALVGNSMGGFVATEAVIQRPQRFERLVLVSAAGLSFAEIKGRRTKALARSIEAAAPFLGGDRKFVLARPAARQFAFGGVMRSPAKLRPELLAEQARPGLSAPGFADAMVSIAGYDTRERLPEIEIPTLVVWGLNDRIVPVEAALGYHRLIPRSRLEIFERTGHVPMLERPARFNRLVDEFIESSRPLEAAQDQTAIG